MMKRYGLLSLSVFAVALLFGWLYLVTPQKFLSLDNRLRDFLFLTRDYKPVSGKVVIVDIDEKSLHAYGQWPWSRNIFAALLDALSESGAGIIGLDIVFAEEDRSGSPVNEMRSEGCRNENDLVLRRVIERSPVIGGYFFSFDFKSADAPSVPAVFIEKGLSERGYLPEPSGARLNIPCLQEAFYSSGFFNTLPDHGGMIRRAPLLMRYHGIIYPSLVLEMFRIYTGTKSVKVENTKTGVERIVLGDLSIPTDRFGRMNINFRGPSRSFEYISAADILSHRVDRRRIEGKFVLIGTSAVGLSDLKPTPYDSVMPGVEIHANALDTLITGDMLFSPHYVEMIDLAMILGSVLLCALLFYMIPVRLILPTAVLTLYGYYAFYYHMLFSEGVILNILMPVGAMLTTLFVVLLLRYLFASEQKEQLQKAFAQKVSPAVMKDILSKPTQELLVPKKKFVTVFFSDIRDFTAISEAIGDPKEVIEILNTYLTPTVESIVRHHGTIDKFIGDAVMAYWNAPTDVAYHADEAVSSALEQIRILEKINREIEKRYPKSYERMLSASEDAKRYGAIRIGIGIHTGEATIGEMGSSGRSDYTVIGDTVNVASRLEGLCKVYGVSLIVSEATKSALKGEYAVRELDTVRVKGKQEAIVIYEISESALPSWEMKAYEEAIRAYKASDYDKAESIFEDLQKRTQSGSERLYAYYRARCESAKRGDRNDYDGIFEFTHK